MSLVLQSFTNSKDLTFASRWRQPQQYLLSNFRTLKASNSHSFEERGNVNSDLTHSDQAPEGGCSPPGPVEPGGGHWWRVCVTPSRGRRPAEVTGGRLTGSSLKPCGLESSNPPPYRRGDRRCNSSGTEAPAADPAWCLGGFAAHQALPSRMAWGDPGVDWVGKLRQQGDPGRRDLSRCPSEVPICYTRSVGNTQEELEVCVQSHGLIALGSQTRRDRSRSQSAAADGCRIFTKDGLGRWGSHRGCEGAAGQHGALAGGGQ